MRRAVVFWAVLTAVGALIVALPDDGRRLVSFSQAHGPSRLDALGIGVLLAGWAAFLAALWRRRGRLAWGAGARWTAAGAFGGGLGAGLVVASAAADFRHWWAVGALVLLAAQLLAAYAATRPDAASGG